MRLIDADMLEDQLGISDEDITFKYMLKDVPTIDAVLVICAHWIEKTTSWNMGCEKYSVCSNCGARKCDTYADNGGKFCDSCGAKMDENIVME